MLFYKTKLNLTTSALFLMIFGISFLACEVQDSASETQLIEGELSLSEANEIMSDGIDITDIYDDMLDSHPNASEDELDALVIEHLKENTKEETITKSVYCSAWKTVAFSCSTSANCSATNRKRFLQRRYCSYWGNQYRWLCSTNRC